jgi:hypothetical protein
MDTVKWRYTMAYEDSDREMDLEDQPNFYEEDPAYGADTYFGERLDNSKGDDELMPDDMPDDMTEDEVVRPTEATDAAEDTFGESIATDEPTVSPHERMMEDEEFEDPDVDSLS